MGLMENSRLLWSLRTATTLVRIRVGIFFSNDPSLPGVSDDKQNAHNECGGPHTSKFFLMCSAAICRSSSV